MSITTRPIPSDIQKALNWWERSAIILRALYVILTMLSIICSVIVGSSSASSAVTSSSTGSSSEFGFLEAWQVAVLSMTAAIAVGVLSALDIRGNAERMRKAWRKLNIAAVRYKEETDYTIKQLNVAYAEAEAMISESKTPT